MPAPIIAGYELDTRSPNSLAGYELDTRSPSSLDGYELDTSGPSSLDGYELAPKEAEMTPEGKPIYGEDDILTKAGWRYRKKTTDTDILKSALEAVKGLGAGFAKIPDVVRSKGFAGASGNLPEAMLAAGEGWKDILDAAISKVGSIGMSEEQDLDRQYDNYREMAERSVAQVKRSRSRVGDFFRAIGAPEHAATMDESIDQDVANSLSMVLDPTNIIGGGSGKALMAAGKGERVAVAGEKILQAAEKASADIAERAAKVAGAAPVGASTAASDVVKTIAVDPTPLRPPTPLSQAGKLAENTGKGLQSMASSLVEWERLNPGYATLGGAAVGAASSNDPLTGAFIGAGAGLGVPRLLKTVPEALRTAGEAAQVVAVAAKEGIDVAAKSGVAGEKVSAVAKRLDTPAANFLLTQSAELSKAVANGAVIGGGLGYAVNNDPEQSGFGSGIGAGIVGGGMGRAQSIGIDQAGRVSVHRPDKDGNWVRVSQSPAALAKDYDLAVSFLASRSLPERTALAGRLNIAELAELARGEAAAMGANRRTGSDMDVRFLDADGMVAAGFDPTLAKVMQGVAQTDQKPVLFINLDVSSDPAMTLWHEAMHGFDKLAPDEVGGKQTDAGASLAQTRAELKAFYFGSFDRDGNRTAPGKYNEAQFLKLEDQYLSRTMSPAEILDHQKKSMSDRAAYIADEMAAEHAGMLGRLSGGDIGKASRYPSTALGRAALGVLARTRIGLESLGIVFDGGGDVVTSGIFKDPTTGKRLELSSDVREKLAAYLRAKDKITTRMSIDFDESPITEVANARDLAKAGTTPETLARWKDSGMFALDDKGEIRMQGGRPVFLTAAERKKVDANRSLAIFTAIKNVPDDGSPGLRSSVVDGVETFVGTKLSKAQIDAVLALPDAVLPPSVKDRISQLVKLQEDAGAPIIADYNKAITGGRYDSKASISTQVFTPMSLSITAAGNFIVTSFSVVGFERKIATWKRTKKKFFEPWGGNMDSFRTDVETYLNNQASGVGNVAVGKEAITKKNSINDFLAAVLVGDMDRVSTKSNSDNLIRAFRVDRIQSIDRASGNNMPYDYRKVRANFQPSDERGPKKRPAQAPPEVPEAAYGYWVTPDGKMLTTNDHIALAHQLLQRKVTLGELTQETYSRQLNNIYPLMAELGYLRVVRESPADYSFDGRNPSPSQRAILESFGIWREKNITHMTNGQGKLFYDADKPKARYQPADADYLAAVKSGDMKVVQGMVDDAAKAAGYAVGPLFHGTRAEFNKFRRGDLGIHWGTQEQASNRGGTRQVSAFLKANPLRIDDDPGFWMGRRLIDLLAEKGVNKSALVEIWNRAANEGMSSGQPNSTADILARGLMGLGIDAIQYPNKFEGAGDSIVVLDPSQIKSASPITRDDNGNVIPLSERFNTTSEDIRYQPADVDYLAAVKSGDMKVVQGMVDEAAKAAGYSHQGLKHGSGARFTKFLASFRGKAAGGVSAKEAFFLTDSERTAKGYAVYAAEEGPVKELMRKADESEKRGDWDSYERLIAQAEDMTYGEAGAKASSERRKNATVYNLAVKGRFLEVDAGGKTAEEFGSLTAKVNEARRKRLDGVVFRNLDDAPYLNDPSTHYAVFDSENIKSADPITRDDNGNVIPLSERFNTTSEDIRYQPKGDADAPHMADPDDSQSIEPVRRKNGKFQVIDYGLAEGMSRHSGPVQDGTLMDFKSLPYDVTGPGQEMINNAVMDGSVDAIKDKLVAEYREAIKNPEIAAGQGWYSRMREHLLARLGPEGRELFSQLLGATSAQTPVGDNFVQSVDGYEGIKSGRYSEVLAKYNEMISLEKSGKLDAAIVERGYIEKLKEMVLEERVVLQKAKTKTDMVSSLASIKALTELIERPVETRTDTMRMSIMRHAEDIAPRKSNGKKFNANSWSVMKVIAGTWLENRDSPKTPNFAGNLTGRTLAATIDIWAARMLRDHIYRNEDTPWRIKPASEEGVSNTDFALGQLIMERAAKEIGINPDDLQAVMWFNEKNKWDNSGWTKGEGAKKASFDDMFHLFFPAGKDPLTFAQGTTELAAIKAVSDAAKKLAEKEVSAANSLKKKEAREAEKAAKKAAIASGART